MTTTTITSALSNTQTWPAVPSKAMRQVGYALSSLAVLFLLMDSVMKLLALPIVLETSTQLGYPASPGLAQALGVILFIFTALYVYPRASILGAVLLTAFLGGAVATHVRVDSPLLTHTLFGVYLGVFLWGGLLLRDERLRALFPWRR
jgi:DoxX-like family